MCADTCWRRARGATTGARADYARLHQPPHALLLLQCIWRCASIRTRPRCREQFRALPKGAAGGVTADGRRFFATHKELQAYEAAVRVAIDRLFKVT